MSSLIVEACKVDEVLVHKNADKLAIYRVKGWHCIAQRDAYKVGDLILYIPIDAVLSQAFAEKIGVDKYLKHQGGNVLRVRTVKLRGSISQGIIISANEVPGVREGDDVSEKLGIIKYEPPVQNISGVQGKPRRQHPDFYKYTDIEHLDNYPDVLVEGEVVTISEKLHGGNCRIGMLHIISYNWFDRIKNWFKKLMGKTWELHVGSHNVDLQETKENLYWKVARRYDFERFLTPNAIIFGEIYGKGVQKLTYDLEDVEVRFFDVMKDGQYVDHEEFLAFCAMQNLPVVPGLYYGPWKKDLVSLADGKSTIASCIREGFVVRPIKERWDHRGGRTIFKCVSAQYLLSKNSEEVIAH